MIQILFQRGICKAYNNCGKNYKDRHDDIFMMPRIHIIIAFSWEYESNNESNIKESPKLLMHFVYRCQMNISSEFEQLWIMLGR